MRFKGNYVNWLTKNFIYQFLQIISWGKHMAQNPKILFVLKGQDNFEFFLRTTERAGTGG